MDRKQIIVGVGIAALLLLGSGCGKVAEKAAEKATEEAINDRTGGDADVDLGSGEVKIDDGKGGSYEVDEDGNVKITDENGDTQISSGEDTKLPDGWPEALNPPRGTKLLSATTSGGTMSVTGTIAGASVEEVYGGLKTQITDAGYTVSGDSVGTGYANLTASSGEGDVVANVGEGGGSEGAYVSITISPKG